MSPHEIDLHIAALTESLSLLCGEDAPLVREVQVRIPRGLDADGVLAPLYRSLAGSRFSHVAVRIARRAGPLGVIHTPVTMRPWSATPAARIRP